MTFHSLFATGWLLVAAIPASCIADPGAEARALNWPRFRGPDGSGVSGAAASVPVEFGPETNVLWKRELPTGHSSPCIWGGRIFLTAFAEEYQRLEVLGKA